MKNEYLVAVYKFSNKTDEVDLQSNIGLNKNDLNDNAHKITQKCIILSEERISLRWNKL